MLGVGRTPLSNMRKTYTYQKNQDRSRCPLKNILKHHNVHYKPMNKATIYRNRIKIKNKEPELHEQTMNAIEKAREQIKQGNFVSMDEVKKRLGL